MQIYTIYPQGDVKVVYVGITSECAIKRFKGHLSHLRRAKVIKCEPLYHFMRRVGVENISISVLEEVENKSIAEQREKYWIKTFLDEGMLVLNVQHNGRYTSKEIRQQINRWFNSVYKPRQGGDFIGLRDSFCLKDRPDLAVYLS